EVHYCNHPSAPSPIAEARRRWQNGVNWICRQCNSGVKIANVTRFTPATDDRMKHQAPFFGAPIVRSDADRASTLPRTQGKGGYSEAAPYLKRSTGCDAAIDPRAMADVGRVQRRVGRRRTAGLRSSRWSSDSSDDLGRRPFRLAGLRPRWTLR